MAMNRVQFPQGMSLFELFEQFGTEAQCQAALEQARWLQGFSCPRCGSSAHYVLHGSTRKPFHCSARRHQTSVIVGTLFESTKLPLPVWFLAIYLVGRLADVLPDDSGSEDLVPCDATLCLLAKPVEDAARSAQRQGAPDGVPSCRSQIVSADVQAARCVRDRSAADSWLGCDLHA